MREFISRDDLHKRVCVNIKKFRKQANLTQAELSEEINMSHDYFRLLESEKGKKDFSFYTLYKISTVLNIPLENFVSEPEQDVLHGDD